MFGGPNLLVLLVMALGAAMVAGNVAALVKPRPPKTGDLQKAPRGRTLAMAAVGGFAVIWSLATLLSR